MANTMQQLDQRELMVLQKYLKDYGQQAEILLEQLSILENGRMEALAAREALEGLRDSVDHPVLLPLGAGVSVKARVIDPENLLLTLGSDIVVERNNSEGVTYLKEKVIEIEASQKSLSETLEKLRVQMQEMSKRIESATKDNRIS